MARQLHNAALAGLAAFAPACWADAPLVSETADVIGADNCQVELALARARASGLPSARGVDVLGSCGVHGHSQAAVGYSSARSEGLTSQSVRAFGKTTLVAPEAGSTGWGLRYGVNVDKAPDTGWRAEGAELLGLMTREIAPGLLFHANLGHVHSRSNHQGSTTWSLGMETVAATTVAADVFGDDRNRPTVSAGVGHKFGHGFSANASVSVQFDRPRVTQWTLGAKIEF